MKHLYEVEYEIGWRRYRPKGGRSSRLEWLDKSTLYILGNGDARSVMERAGKVARRQHKPFEDWDSTINTVGKGKFLGTMKPEQVRLLKVEQGVEVHT